DGVRTLEHELARLVVENLAGNRVELDLQIEGADFADVDGKKIEEQGAVGLRCERQHLPLLLGGELVEDDHEIGRFAAETGAVIHDLGRHLTGSVIEQDHRVNLSNTRSFACEYRTRTEVWSASHHRIRICERRRAD